ncbi:MAG: ATP-binding cassette domain-containing protein [Rhizobiales bacterium]|nr:ATP-binding cassette domain-containing protein [Hyphomicrobiales bacterium]
MDAEKPILEIRNLELYFPVRQGVFKKVVAHIKAVDGINLDVIRGEILGLVGESGCGKTTLGKSILQLIRPTKGDV